MDDLSALAEAITAGVGDARGSLILSRDGLVLGAHPPEAEGLVRSAWIRFASLGEPERGFVQFGTEIWSFVRRGPYAAFVVTGTGVRPGLVIDRIEQALLAAEVARASEVHRAPEPLPPAQAPLSKPRTPLHPEPRPTEPSVLIEVSGPTNEEGATAPPPPPPHVGTTDEGPTQAPGVPLAERSDEAPGEPPQGGGSGAEEPGGGEVPPPPVAPRVPAVGGSAWASPKTSEEGEREEEEVDRVSLAREFSQLLQEDPNAADG
jgi:hypothetical protein